MRLLESHINASVRSFSTCIVFAINPTSSKEGGYGFTFTLSPTPYRRRAGSGQYMGLLNNITNGNPRNHVFAVEFDTIQGFKDGSHRMGNHVGSISIVYNPILKDLSCFTKGSRRKNCYSKRENPSKRIYCMTETQNY